MSSGKRTAARQRPQITQQEIDALAHEIGALALKVGDATVRIAKKCNIERGSADITVVGLQEALREFGRKTDKCDEFLSEVRSLY